MKMKMTSYRFILWLPLALSCLLPAMTYAQMPVALTLPADAPARVHYGADRLIAALRSVGYQAAFQKKTTTGLQVMISNRKDTAAGKEGYSITSSGNTIRIRGNDASGALYGCLELADRIRSTGHWPAGIQRQDHPEMALRGACIGLQKPALLPGRGPYEYPYTPENFPWFYDKALWIKYLDSMVNNRMNTLYLWNGHPFASLVRVPEYPYAVEVDDATFKKNEEIYRFLTEEADRRGIWVIQLFYNIIVSKPFAEHNHIKTQDRNRHIVPLIADYTRKSIAAFVEKYPHVGLMITLGEAMEGVGQDDIDWFTGTILPGIKDGLRALGRTELPPVVLRAHDTDGPAVMKAALPLYSNLYVEAKYNGEALTTYTPHGPWADLHRKLSSISKGLIENVHIMANLEPFRYGSADFIQKCVQAMHTVYGANGLHLYPQASYWDWPYSADKTSPRLLEMDRDWIWYAAWARYAWNCHRDRQDEIKFWSDRLAARYGCDEQQGAAILEAYEQSGDIAPKLLRRLGITDGNRQTLTLGMLMTQLIDPERYGLFTLLYESEGPVGEMLGEYAEKEWKQLPHIGETPVQVCDEVQAAGKAALRAIEQAGPFIKDSLAEFGRLRNDMACYKALADCYALKARAALYILRYKYSNDLEDLEKALPLLQNSLTSFRELSRLTEPAYGYANSMQTQQRKIPMRGVDGKYKTWTEMLPVYEKELADFSNHLDSLKAHPDSEKAAPPPPAFKAASVQLITKTEGNYAVDSSSQVFSDTSFVIRAAAAPLKDLKGIRLSAQQQRLQGTELKFRNTEPVDLLIGFFEEKKPGQKEAALQAASYLPPPQLETDASANDYGQAEPKIINALVIDGLPPVNIHAWTFPPGTHTLSLGKGMCLVLGFVKTGGKQKTYDAGLNDPGKKKLDWLFE
ncbi:MAG TPA: glycoside hydrolase family 20 zincin-like fold domain-containing protein [Puia sp.]|nr:glycoside hydrolase family 20 zincin-like fold domain-containing protein [Puia sp.]